MAYSEHYDGFPAGSVPRIQCDQVGISASSSIILLTVNSQGSEHRCLLYKVQWMIKLLLIFSLVSDKELIYFPGKKTKTPKGLNHLGTK
ncbi:hypothetical protein XELAEV_18020658mg [Xenopus laevis]|uniref:Uncharacterized protein n=1 Tax=Xenopus laevis TaxID=8355 RepID=A0A974DA51_XENLA|nr:hypothetical protein XELAEV_18020658mg [Xenopus laevis]